MEDEGSVSAHLISSLHCNYLAIPHLTFRRPPYMPVDLTLIDFLQSVPLLKILSK